MRQLLERTLPSSIDAEKAVLGAMLVDNSRIYQVSESLAADDFYLDAHRILMRTIVGLAEENVSVDFVTLQDRLLRESALESAGGIGYILGLCEGIPLLISLTHHIDIIKEKSLARKLILVSSQLMANCLDQAEPAAAILAGAERQLLELAATKTSSRLVPAIELQSKVIEYLTQLYNDRKGVTGLATGFVDLDRLTSGFQPGDLVILAARPSCGKAQPLSSKVLTPSGFKAMGDLRVGDMVLGGSSGSAVTVTGVFPQGIKPVFRVTFCDKSSTLCCDDHLWLTTSRAERAMGYGYSVKSTKTLRKTLRAKGGTTNNHRVPVSPVCYFSEPDELPLDPYLMGLLLGDGCFCKGNIVFDKPEDDLHERLAALLPAADVVGRRAGMTARIKRSVKNNSKSETKTILAKLGLDGLRSVEKFIPHQYLVSSPEHRWELLVGLCDTDGHVCRQRVEFSTSSPLMASDFRFLVNSLGGVITGNRTLAKSWYMKDGERHAGSGKFRLSVYFQDGRMPVSSAKHKLKVGPPYKTYHRAIESIEPVGSMECQCISVSDACGLYITDDFVVTHNTALALNMASHVMKQGKSVAIFSLEMTAMQLMMRMACSQAMMDAHKVRTGYMSKEEYATIIEEVESIGKSKLRVDDSAASSVMDIMSKARRMKADDDLHLVVVDYLQLIMGTNSKENRNQEISAISRGLKLLAKELGVPVLALSQLNRKTEERTGDQLGRPRLSDLRESGSIEQDADTVMAIYREELYHPTTENSGVAELMLLKQRNGPVGTVKLAFLKAFVKFESMLDGY